MKKSFLILFVLICCLTDSFAGKNKREEAFEEGASLEQGTGVAKKLRPDEDGLSDKGSETSHIASSDKGSSLDKSTQPESHSEKVPQGKENKEKNFKVPLPKSKSQLPKREFKRTDSRTLLDGKTIHLQKVDNLN